MHILTYLLSAHSIADLSAALVVAVAEQMQFREATHHAHRPLTHTPFTQRTDACWELHACCL